MSIPGTGMCFMKCPIQGRGGSPRTGAGIMREGRTLRPSLSRSPIPVAQTARRPWRLTRPHSLRFASFGEASNNKRLSVSALWADVLRINTMKKSNASIIKIENKIFIIRGQRVMLDADLSELYGTSTKALNQAVKRNINRFPSDFMFQLNSHEKSEVVTICDHLPGIKYSKTLPYAFTEHGTIMAASVLNSIKAVEMSIFIVRAFIKLRELLSSNKALGQKLAELEQKVGKQDEKIAAIILTIRKLIGDEKKGEIKTIGFER